MSSPNFSVVKATTANDITFAFEYVRSEEKWGLAANDDEIFFAMAPERCYCGMLGDEKISYLQTMTYGKKEEYCYFGVYIVKKEYRQKGFGKQTWDRAWAELPETCLATLSAVLPQEATYIRSGFKTAWNEHSYAFDAQKIAGLPLSNESSVNIIRYKDADLKNLLQYDTSAFCFSRESYLKKVLEVSDCEGWVATNKEGKIIGYVVARFTLDMYGWFLLPLIADNASVAEILLVELSKFLSDQPKKRFSMTIPAINESSIAFAEKYSEALLFETVRMFARGSPSDKMIENHAQKIYSMSYAIG